MHTQITTKNYREIPGDLNSLKKFWEQLTQKNIGSAVTELHVLKNKEAMNEPWNDSHIIWEFNESLCFWPSITDYKSKLIHDDNFFNNSESSKTLINHIILNIKTKENSSDYHSLLEMLNNTIHADVKNLIPFFCVCNKVIYSSPYALDLNTNHNLLLIPNHNDPILIQSWNSEIVDDYLQLLFTSNDILW